MKFYVTQKDINAGKKGSCSKCPVALCLKRRFPRKRVVVGFGLNIGNDGFDVSAKVRRFINQFDSGKKVKPFSFSIPNLERIMQ